MAEPEYKTPYDHLLPPLTRTEYAALTESIKEQGQMYPIVVNEENEILDGHHRYRICKELGITPKVVTRNYADKKLEKQFVIGSNLLRRQMNDFQKVESIIWFLKEEQEDAKQRQLAGTFVSIDAKGRSAERIASRIGVSLPTFERARKIIESGDSVFIKKCRESKITIWNAYNQILVKQRKLKTPDLPDGQFDVIVADPPWKYDFSPSNGAAEHKYPTMITEEICNLKIPIAKDAIFFEWVTSSKIPDGIKVIEAWG
ncbi:MAG: hypothetical protein FJ356_04905, partial [Thaumarchaeota archaeon]|nr:hypothetical protein [Nitrososphaerota archaeon]